MHQFVIFTKLFNKRLIQCTTQIETGNLDGTPQPIKTATINTMTDFLTTTIIDYFQRVLSNEELRSSIIRIPITLTTNFWETINYLIGVAAEPAAYLAAEPA